MPCHHCQRARRAVVEVAKAVVRGDVGAAAEAAKASVEHVKAKASSQKDDTPQ